MVILLKQHVVASYMCLTSYPIDVQSIGSTTFVQRHKCLGMATDLFFSFFLFSCVRQMLYPSTCLYTQVQVQQWFLLTENKCFFVTMKQVHVYKPVYTHSVYSC